MATLTPMASDIPPDLKCGICLDIAIDPVVPASTSTEGKTEVICKHFLCRACEHIARTFALETRDEINCSQCRTIYQEVMPDDETADKIKDFVKKQPHLFNNESYDKLVEARKNSIPVAIQIHDAIKEGKYDAIEKIASQIIDEREKSRVLFDLAIKQIKKGNIEAGKVLVNCIPQIVWQTQAALQVMIFYLKQGLIDETEKYVTSFPDNPLKKALLRALIPMLKQGLANPALPEFQKEFLFSKILNLINIASDIPARIPRSINTVNTLMAKATLYFISGKQDEAKSFLEKAKEQCKEIPNETLKCQMLIQMATELIQVNSKYALELSREVGNQIDDLEINSSTKNVLYTALFSVFLQGNELKETEYYAKKISEKPSNLNETLREFKKNLNLLMIIEGSDCEADEKSTEEQFDFLKKMGLDNISLPKLFALFGVAQKYLENNEIADGFRILKELHPIPEDFPSITFLGNNIDLKNEINNLVKSTYEKMLRNTNLSACEQIEASKLLTEEEIQEIQKGLPDQLELKKALLAMKKDSPKRSRAMKCSNLIPLTGLLLSFLIYTALNLNKQN